MPTDAAWLDWIKKLPADDDIKTIAETVGLHPCEVVGRLIALWALDDRRHEDETADQLSVAAVDEHVGCQGFAVALFNAGWMLQSTTGVEFTYFARCRKDQAKKRRCGHAAVERHRDRERKEQQAEELYEAFPKHVAIRRALEKIRIALDKVEFDFLLRKTQEFNESVAHIDRKSEEWQKVPGPASWYFNECWNDRPEDRHTAKPETHRSGRVESPPGKYEGL